ncbi:MAG: integral rane sensor signal transduction histidine kinase [Ramlibacter sp.]|nr:integral rane sensor signal transduction histidine kinase [Ramlibacter sp.]
MPRTDSPRWHRRARHALGHSLRLRLVALFLLLALGMTVAFLGGMQKALGIGWRDAARPLVSDYVDRLVAEIGSPPSIERARALAQRLPVSVRISGPQVNWDSGSGAEHDAGWDNNEGPRGRPLLQRTTADGHRIRLGLNLATLQNQPRRVGWITLAVLLALTALAYGYVRRLLRPLDDIRTGAARFGSGDFGTPIPLRRRDELGQLASDVNAMAHSIHQMLEAKRGLLLAISHELRSPLTRARVNTELLPETPEVLAQRQALLRDLAQMRDLVTDLLESERLGQGHAALQLEPTDLGALAREVAAQLVAHSAGKAGAQPLRLEIAAGLPEVRVDRSRVRLLLRNLLDNALRHSAGAAQAPELTVQPEGKGVGITVRDHGTGVEEAALAHLAEPFYRPDAARERSTGGVGLGLYLSRLVALAHGGSFAIRNAHPGLEVRVVLPGP